MDDIVLINDKDICCHPLEAGLTDRPTDRPTDRQTDRLTD